MNQPSIILLFPVDTFAKNNLGITTMLQSVDDMPRHTAELATGLDGRRAELSRRGFSERVFRKGSQKGPRKEFPERVPAKEGIPWGGFTITNY